jgi:hypothetical protein
MMKLWLVLFFFIRSSLAANDLLFYTEDRIVDIAVSLENKRINLIVDTANVTLDSIRAKSASLNNVKKRKDSLIGTDIMVLTAHNLVMDQAAKTYAEGDMCLSSAIKITIPALEAKISSSCVYTVKPYPAEEIDEAIQQMVKLADSMKTYVFEELATDAAKRSSVSKVKAKYLDLAGIYKEKSCELLNTVDRLSALQFNEEFRGLIETLPCITHSYAEKYLIKHCAKEPQGLNCFLEVGLPLVTKKFMKLVLLNYENSQLYIPESTFLAIDMESHMLKTLNCQDSLAVNSDSMPLCVATNLPEPCMTSLLGQDIVQSMLTCEFTVTEPVRVQRLGDDSVLIMGKQVKIREEGRAITQKPPITILTNNALTIESKGETVVFTADVRIKYPSLSFTRLDSLQIAGVISRAKRDDFWRNFAFTDYVQYLIMLIEGLLAPVTITTAIYTCIKARLHRHVQSTVDSEEQEGISLKRIARRAHFQRNRALLV